MSERPQPSRAARIEARVRTGPAAHLLGGALDLGRALLAAGARALLARVGTRAGWFARMRRR